MGKSKRGEGESVESQTPKKRRIKPTLLESPKEASEVGKELQKVLDKDLDNLLSKGQSVHVKVQAPSDNLDELHLEIKKKAEMEPCPLAAIFSDSDSSDQIGEAVKS